MQLFTSNNFTVVRQIANHTDATTYYVRAVIRNAYTDAIITTLDLDSKGAQRYSKAWKVPADPSGEGFYVSIVTSVYTDSGYTTKSNDYGDEETTYLVVDRPRSNNGGGYGLSGRDVRDIFSEEIQKILPIITPKKEEDPEEVETEEEEEIPDPRIDAIIKMLEVISKKIDAIEKVDLKPISSDIKALGKQIDAIEIPKLDLSPILSKMEENDSTDEMTKEEMTAQLSEMEDTIVGEIKKSVTGALKDMNFVTTFVTTSKLGDHKEVDKGGSEEPKAEEEIDLSKLSL